MDAIGARRVAMTTRRTSDYNHILNMVLMNTISRRFSAALFLFGASVAAGVGCQFAASVDRNDIPGDGGGGGANQGGGSNQGGDNQGGGGSGPGCSDETKNGSETDVDCGGADCPVCEVGQACAVGGDCDSGKCTTDVCTEALLISEVRSRGTAGADDEFIELYNPSSVAVTTDATWRVVTREAPGGGNCNNNPDASTWIGSGEVIPPHGHLLIGGADYDGSVAADVTAVAAFIDSASVRVEHGAVVVDALCFNFNQATQDQLALCPIPYVCEGPSITNPHDNTAGTDDDSSLERRPGGSGGNATDTGDSSADFGEITPSSPENLDSPAAP